MPQLICVQMLLGTLLKNRLKSKKWKLSRKSQLWKSVFSLQNKPAQFENWCIFLVTAESWGFRINFLRLNQHIHSENHSQDPGTLDQRTIGRNTDSSFSESECEPAWRWGTAISEQLSRDPTRFPLWIKSKRHSRHRLWSGSVSGVKQTHNFPQQIHALQKTSLPEL